LRDEIISESLGSSSYLRDLQNELELQQKGIDQLQEQKKQLEKDLEGVYEKCYDQGYDKSFADKQSQKIHERLD
jgi:predicted transcriptional regulator